MALLEIWRKAKLISHIHFCPRSAILYHTIFQGSPGPRQWAQFITLYIILSLAFNTRVTCLIPMASCPKHCGISINLCILRASLPVIYPSFFPLLSLPLWVLIDKIQFKSLILMPWLGSNQITQEFNEMGSVTPTHKARDWRHSTVKHGLTTVWTQWGLFSLDLLTGPGCRQCFSQHGNSETILHGGTDPPPAYRVEGSLGMKWLVSSVQ